MKKKSQEKSLDELIKRVIQKDIDIQNRHEKDEIKNATKEALIEMTELSIGEINNIEKKILSDSLKKREKRKKITKYLIVFSLLLCFFLYFYYSTRIKGKKDFKENYKDSLVFEENFDDNSNKWPIYDSEIGKSYIENGQYIFQVYDIEYCKYAMIPIKIGRYAKIKFASTWLDGKQKYYGIKLKNTNGDFFIFAIKPDGTARLCQSTNNENMYTYNNLDIGDYTDRTKPIEQTIILKGNIIEYYVINQLIVTVHINKYPFYKIGFSNCPDQTVAFDGLKIWK